MTKESIATIGERATTAAREGTARQVGTARYVPGTPRWARIATHAVPLVVAPAGIWRLLLALGWAGLADPATHHRTSSGQFAYIVMLTAISESLALLTFGLVKPWGERVPRWVPVLGGRHVRTNAAVIPAATGAMLLALMSAYFFLNPIMFHVHFTPLVGPKGTPTSHLAVTGWAKVLLVACYAPLPAWPVLLGAVTYAYRRRRRDGLSGPATS